MGNTPVPKFTYPGDNPELDRLLNEARIEGEEDLTSFPDMFGRRRARAAEGDVDQDAATNPGSPWERKDAGEIDRGALPSALMPNVTVRVVSTRPVTREETPAGVPAKMQARWLRLGVLAIVAPVAALALGVAFVRAKLPQGALNAPPTAGSVAAMAAPPVVSMAAAPAPKATAAAVIEEDAGAPAVRIEPDAGVLNVKPKATAEDPYSEPPRKPGAGKPGSTPMIF